jgi:outer membrane protein TolC
MHARDMQAGRDFAMLTRKPAAAPFSRAGLAALALAAGLAAGRPAAARGPAPAATPGEAAPAPARTPEVSDPMLALPPPAPRQIASWDDALALIRAQSPDYASSAQSVVRAEAQKRIALAAVLPTLLGQVGYTHQFITQMLPLGSGGTPETYPPPDVFALGGTLAWNVLNPRGLYGVKTADVGIEVARLSFADRRRAIAVAVVDALLSTLAAERVAELNRVGLRAALERLELTRTRQQYGQGTALDVDRAQEDVESARALILSGDESLRQAREALGVALGVPTATSAPGDLDLEQFEQSVAHTCRPNDDIERRPDIAAARKRVEVASRAVRDAELMLAPSIALSTQAQYQSEVVFGPNTNWSVQGVLNLPFYDGGARYGAMRDARAALEQARQSLVSARLSAIVGSAQAFREVTVLQASREVARRQRDLAERIDARTREGYARGLGTSLDLVTSAQALRQAEIDLALLDFRVGSARAAAALINAECLY